MPCKDLILEIFKIFSFFVIHATCIHGHYFSLLPNSFKTKPFLFDIISLRLPNSFKTKPFLFNISSLHIHSNPICFDAKSLSILLMWFLKIFQFFGQIIIKTLITICSLSLSLFGFSANWSLYLHCVIIITTNLINWTRSLREPFWSLLRHIPLWLVLQHNPTMFKCKSCFFAGCWSWCNFI